MNTNLKDTELAYAAGIMDGEGNIGIYANTSKPGYPIYRMRVRVNNTNEWLIQWLKLSFGGCIGVQLRPAGKDWRPAWYWTQSCNPACAFLEQILPYLQLKKPQAELAIKFQKARRGRTGHRLSESEMTIAATERFLMQNMNIRGLPENHKINI